MNSLAKILYIDDEEELLMLVSAYFSNHSIHVDTCLDIQTALQTINTSHYDLIICDVRMPCGGGLELLNILQKEGSYHGQFVLITGDSLINEIISNINVDLVLLKPIDFSEILIAVKNLLSI